MTLDRRRGIPFLPVAVPCGGCDGCRLERSRQWAIRCMHEASLHEENSFITLTYSDESLPWDGGLDREAFPKFMKRLRKSIAPRKVRFFHAGEYGSRFGRPHYHSCLFGYDFPDKTPWSTRAGFPVWRSEALERLWPHGQSEIGTVTYESAAYVARYIVKKHRGPKEEFVSVAAETGEVFPREKEYATMSRRPGIGRQWIDRFLDEVYATDGVVVQGRLQKPPRYYDQVLAELDPTRHEMVCNERLRRLQREEQTEERLAVREEVLQANLKRKERVLE